MCNSNRENKNSIEFDLEKTKQVFEQVHNYFKHNPNLKPIKSKNTMSDNSNQDNNIIKFKIQKNSKSIYEEILSTDDIKIIIDDIKCKYNNLTESIKPILQDKECDENTKKALKAIVNSFKNFGKNIDRLDRGIYDELSLDKNKEKFIENTNKLIKDRIIKDAIQPIYQGMKHSENYIYDNLLICINQWLQNMGIYTLEIREMDKIDDFMFNYIDSISTEITKDYKIHETIKEVIQYPYMFDKENIVCGGEIVSWRCE